MNASEVFEYASRRHLLARHFELARSRLDEVEEYSDRFERFMLNESANIRAQVRGQTILMDPQDARTQLHIDCLAEDVAQVEETFPQIFRASLFIQCCSDLEHTLMRLARCHEAYSAAKLDQVKGDRGIRRAHLS